jgi:RimJ/RimL family protein N-acetyltransferase
MEFGLSEILTTSRLTLRRITMDDVPAMHAIFADANVMAYWSRLPHTELAETEDWVAKNIAAGVSGEADDFVVIRDGALVGRIGIWQANELGLIFARSVWGTGIAREAVEALIERSPARYDVDHGGYRSAQRPRSPVPGEARVQEDGCGEEHL